MNTINERIESIINTLYNGNVSRFSRETGISQPLLFQVVSGRKSMPSALTLERIANAIDTLDTRWLLTGKGAMMVHDNATTTENVPSQKNVQVATVVKKQVVSVI